MLLKISNLNRFGLCSCTDSQNRGTSVDHHIYTSHCLRSKHDFLHVLRMFLSWLFFILLCVFFILPWFSLFCRHFLYSAIAFFILPIVFFILPWFSFFCREYSLFCRDFVYVVVTLIILPWFCFSCRDSYGPP